MNGTSTWLASHDRFFHEANGTAYIYRSTDLIEWENVYNVTPVRLGRNGACFHLASFSTHRGLIPHPHPPPPLKKDVLGAAV